MKKIKNHIRSTLLFLLEKLGMEKVKIDIQPTEWKFFTTN